MFEDFISFQELIPQHVEKSSGLTRSGFCAVAGLSYGGGGLFMYALRHPEMCRFVR
jgi:S-formylglutathione hydrolase FrmB